MTALPASAASDTADTEMIQLADFEAIFLRFQGPITHFILHTVGNREQAFDLAQDVFVKVYKALLSGTLIPQRALPTWLYRIAANTVTDALRRQRLIAWLPLSLFNEESAIGRGTATEAFHTRHEKGERSGWMTTTRSMHKQGPFNGAQFEERVADCQIIEEVFRQMSPNYSACLWLHKHEGLSCPEIAETLHISVPATKMRLQRAREQFLTLYRKELAAC
jgi:RNA polymerase sigma-70 factor, ECF subfamily